MEGIMDSALGDDLVDEITDRKTLLAAASSSSLAGAVENELEREIIGGGKSCLCLSVVVVYMMNDWDMHTCRRSNILLHIILLLKQ